ncbi:SprT-like protein [Scopulibacillus daqui]|uniref:Protein SprT-like n=1 Tax=Scopulibacillus daqui TaxID=1469162 RepID=A0ABS2PXA8_9BACL|nr:SprT family protein [Scopulibacillus daqui]MBM7644684.1 SprT-like protein [Scopulibacillus daqui]
MTNKELQALVEQISLKYFKKPFKHQAAFNKRLRTTGGRYLLASHNLEFNPKQLEFYGKDEFIKIIKHELCHYHLHIEGKGYRHRDRDFQVLLSDVGGSRYCKTIPGTRNQARHIHVYECKKCRERYYRKRKIDTNQYVCGKCRGKLRWVLKKTCR